VKALRILGVICAVLLMAGEGYRSWGAGRPAVFWMDDMLAGSMMIAAAILVGRQTFATRSFFAASWGVAVGMLYGSFFGKLYDPAGSNPGNFSIGVLTWLVGAAFVIAIGGLVASVLLPGPRR